MVRVVDISKLQGIQVGEGSMHLKVEGPQITSNTDCWLFRADDTGTLEVSRCNHHNDHDRGLVTIQALSALIYGGYIIDDFLIWEWAELNQSQMDELGRLFPPVLTKIFQQF